MYGAHCTTVLDNALYQNDLEGSLIFDNGILICWYAVHIAQQGWSEQRNFCLKMCTTSSDKIVFFTDEKSESATEKCVQNFKIIIVTAT